MTLVFASRVKSNQLIEIQAAEDFAAIVSICCKVSILQAAATIRH